MGHASVVPQVECPCIDIAATNTSWYVNPPFPPPPRCETPISPPFRVSGHPHLPVAGERNSAGVRRGCATQRLMQPHFSKHVDRLPCEKFVSRAEMALWDTATLRTELQTLQTRGSSGSSGARARNHVDGPAHAHVADDKLLEEVRELGRCDMRCAPLTRACTHTTRHSHAVYARLSGRDREPFTLEGSPGTTQALCFSRPPTAC